MVRIDLHTHSVASYDGGISETAYRHAIGKKLDYIAITDHNRIDFAQKMHAELGDTIIVGEEISTDAGDIIGLFLHDTVQPHLSLKQAVQAIKNQGGLVYIPHPFETIRKGVSLIDLATISNDVDIVETQNGRAFAQNRHAQAVEWAKKHAKSPITSSDAHHSHGLGKSYTIISETPTKQNLVSLLLSCEHVYTRPGFRSLAAPKMNRIKKSVRGHRHD